MRMFNTHFKSLMLALVATTCSCTVEAEIKALTFNEVRTQLDQISGYNLTQITNLCNVQISYPTDSEWNKRLSEQCYQLKYTRTLRHFRKGGNVYRGHRQSIGFPSFKSNNTRRLVF